MRRKSLAIRKIKEIVETFSEVSLCHVSVDSTCGSRNVFNYTTHNSTRGLHAQLCQRHWPVKYIGNTYFVRLPPFEVTNAAQWQIAVAINRTCIGLWPTSHYSGWFYRWSTVGSGDEACESSPKSLEHNIVK